MAAKTRINESILLTIKKMLGADPEYTPFDTDILVEINSNIQDLIEIGVGPNDGFVVESADETWEELLNDRRDLESAKEYIYLGCKLVFDPPQSSAVIAHFEKRKSEIIWRLSSKVEVG